MPSLEVVDGLNAGVGRRSPKSIRAARPSSWLIDGGDPVCMAGVRVAGYMSH